ncbi:MAG: primosomal protein N' [Nitrospinaceae bacterium]
MTLSSTTETPPCPHTGRETEIFAEVVFNLPLKEPFTYRVPPRFHSLLQVGMRVLVPFGRRKLTGYVVSLSSQKNSALSLKDIADLPDTDPILSEDILNLTRWVADYYQSSWGEAIRAALPAGLDEEAREVLTLSEKGAAILENGGLQESRALVLETLRDRKRQTQKQLERSLQNRFSAYALARLKQEGLVNCEPPRRHGTVDYKYEKTARRVSPDRDPEDVEKRLRRSPKQKAIYELLRGGEVKLTALAKKLPAYNGPLKKLQEKGLVEILKKKNRREILPTASGPALSVEKPLQFTPGQEKVYKELRRSMEAAEFHTFLLHGITGSGKTEIYLRCIQRALEQGRTAIMMVPEISLTPQTMARFQKRFGNRVAILHSGLSPLERYQEWRKIREGRVSIVVGARSAVFAPFRNPGVIVIDEEHDSSYKQDSTPRYHARDTAIIRARAQNAVVILGSATPSMESLANTESGKYRYLSLGKRVQNRLLPVVSIVDMKKERDERKNFSIFSGELKSAIRHRLEQGEQVFLFLNRRGTANYVFCKECGFVFHCTRCSVTLTFHGRENLLRCHYCNFITRTPSACADCRGEVIRFLGFGTQKLEEETRRLFPEAKIIRLDRDTTRHRSAFETMHQAMHAGEVDILIGTQMITKGHDFPNVTLVGVTHADLSLNIPDFRSCERSFQLLTQVAGRAGRGQVPGKVIIQTFHPGHYVFDFVREHDYLNFFQKEVGLRGKLNYPPFTRMVALEIESGEEPAGERMARQTKSALAHILTRTPGGAELLGPSRAALYRIKNKFRWHIILRARRMQTLQAILRQFNQVREKQPAFTGKAKLTIDVDPINLL